MADYEHSSENVRLKEIERTTLNRQKRKRNSGELMKEQNKKRKMQEKPLITGAIRFYVQNETEKTSFFNKLDEAKLFISDKISSVSNYSVLSKALDYFMETKRMDKSTQSDSNQSEHKYFGYLYCDRNDTNQDMFICTKSAVKNMMYGVQEHSVVCKNLLDVSDMQIFGHVCKTFLKCSAGHTVKFDSSPHIEGGKYLVNLRMIHGMNTSGLRYIQYERFMKAAGLGICSETMFSDVHDIYCDATENCAYKSTENAVSLEIGQSVANNENTAEFQGIDIITDARHGTRKNSAYSDIIALGGVTHRVVSAKTVSREEERISQRHELVGVKRMYKEFQSKNIKIRIHGHDRNSSVNKYLATEHPTVKNANDTWHATKGISKSLKNITSGPKKNCGKTWHEELSDKAAAVKTATYFAMKTCNGSAAKLRDILDNIPEHYQGNHDKCPSQSRCQVEGDTYESSKCDLKDPVAINLLKTAIKKLQIYRTPGDYVACVDTHYVESFNNAALIYHDKRITFGAKEYRRRTHMSILDWNENVDREFTSAVLWEDVKNPRRRSGHKNLKSKSNDFVKDIWNSVMDKFYQK